MRNPGAQIRDVIVLLALASILFLANIATPSLQSLDDCFYARKGIELGRSGRIFTVTWNYHPTFQNPPLQFWILGQSFALFGEGDFAARLPSALMALGILLFTLRIGRTALGNKEGATAMSLLAICPYYVTNARRCMLEIPTAFWITLCFLVMIEGIRRPKTHLLLAFPLAGSLLTKSLLGLLPLLIFGIAAAFDQEIRDRWKLPWIWIGAFIGVALGASWPIHEWLVFGKEAVRSHYFGEIFSRSTQSLPLLKRIFGYPSILLGSFEPVILPAIAGFVLLVRTKRALWIAAWALAPVILYSISSAQSSRYLFPVFPALALCGAAWLESKVPRVAETIRRWIAPAVLLTAILLLWFYPRWIERDENRDFKQNAAVIQNAVPDHQSIAYRGAHYWKFANPLLYYDDRFLMNEGSGTSPYVLCDRDRAIGVEGSILISSKEWVLIAPKN